MYRNASVFRIVPFLPPTPHRHTAGGLSACTLLHIIYLNGPVLLYPVMLHPCNVTFFPPTGTLQVGYRQPSDEPEAEGDDAEFEATVPTWQQTVRAVLE